MTFAIVSPPSPGKPTSPILSTKYYGDNARITVCATQGGRKYMEDRVHVHCQRGDDGRIAHSFYAVYDGHGGSSAADFTRDNLYNNLLAHELFNSSDDDDVMKALEESFLKTHYDMLKVVDDWPRTASGYRSTAGTTASAALVMRGKMYTAHVGDSAIVAGRTIASDDPIIHLHSIGGTMLTTEHKPEAEEEHRRIVADGGEIGNKSGVMRVVWNRTRKNASSGPVRRSVGKERIPFLAVARSLGDLWSFNEETQRFVVSPKPDTAVIELDASFKCIVLASDGLWNVMRAQNAVDIVNAREWRRFPAGAICAGEETRPVEHRPTHENHARALIRHGLRLWSHMRADNITALVVVFDTLSTHIPAVRPCVQVSALAPEQMDVLFTDQPDAMIRVSDTQTQVLHTTPIELVYNGAIDSPTGGPPLRVTPSIISTMREVYGHVYSGPGFTLYTTGAPEFTLDNSMSARINELKPSTLTANLVRRQRSSAEQSAVSMVKPQPIVVDAPATPCDVTKQKATYYCHKHGLTCEKVVRLNSQPVGARSPSRGGDVSPPHAHDDLRRHGGNKYFCRKHGLTCEKVQRMNTEYQQTRGTTEDEGSDEEAPRPATRLRTQSSAAELGARGTPLGKRTYDQSTSSGTSEAQPSTPVSVRMTQPQAEESLYNLRTSTRQSADHSIHRSMSTANGRHNKLGRRPRPSLPGRLRSTLASRRQQPPRRDPSHRLSMMTDRPTRLARTTGPPPPFTPTTEHTLHLINDMQLNSARKPTSSSSSTLPPATSDDGQSASTVHRRNSTASDRGRTSTAEDEQPHKRMRLMTWVSGLFGGRGA